MSGAETEVHVFHYPTHSLIWDITTTAGSGCFGRVDHVHTPAGDDAFVWCHPYLTRDDAERAIAGTVADHVDNGDALGAVLVVRHRNDAVRVASPEVTAPR